MYKKINTSFAQFQQRINWILNISTYRNNFRWSIQWIGGILHTENTITSRPAWSEPEKQTNSHNKRKEENTINNLSYS